MKNLYYRDELLDLVEDWSIQQLEEYIQKLEERTVYIQDQIRALKALRRRKNRNKNAKENGPRGGM